MSGLKIQQSTTWRAIEYCRHMLLLTWGKHSHPPAWVVLQWPVEKQDEVPNFFYPLLGIADERAGAI
jgi:hypothetical protein